MWNALAKISHVETLRCLTCTDPTTPVETLCCLTCTDPTTPKEIYAALPVQTSLLLFSRNINSNLTYNNVYF
jgi:hypothetical protein